MYLLMLDCLFIISWIQHNIWFSCQTVWMMSDGEPESDRQSLEENIFAGTSVDFYLLYTQTCGGKTFKNEIHHFTYYPNTNNTNVLMICWSTNMSVQVKATWQQIPRLFLFASRLTSAYVHICASKVYQFCCCSCNYLPLITAAGNLISYDSLK